jgi:hypothetical protein
MASLFVALAWCGDDRPSGGDVWELRVPAVEAGADDRSLRAVYQIFGRTPIADALVRMDEEKIGLTLRARIPETIIAWGFQCADVPLPEAAAGRSIVDDSIRRYPGSESGIDGTVAAAQGRGCPRRNPSAHASPVSGSDWSVSAADTCPGASLSPRETAAPAGAAVPQHSPSMRGR